MHNASPPADILSEQLYRMCPVMAPRWRACFAAGMTLIGVVGLVDAVSTATYLIVWFGLVGALTVTWGRTGFRETELMKSTTLRNLGFAPIAFLPLLHLSDASPLILGMHMSVVILVTCSGAWWYFHPIGVIGRSFIDQTLQPELAELDGMAGQLLDFLAYCGCVEGARSIDVGRLSCALGLTTAECSNLLGDLALLGIVEFWDESGKRVWVTRTAVSPS